MLAVVLIIFGVPVTLGLVLMRKPKVPVDPLTDPKLSCFVRGLIRSMKETPGEWGVNTCAVCHHATGIWIWDGLTVSFSVDKRQDGVIDYPWTRHERNALKDAAKTLRGTSSIDPADSAFKRFEKLGCP